MARRRPADSALLRNALIACPASGLSSTRDLLLRARDGEFSRYCADLREHVVMPALINAHDHLHLNGIAPLPHSRTFTNSYAWSAAFAARFGDADVKAVLAMPAELRHWQGALKNALCGTSTVMHHDPAQPLFARPEFPVRTVRAYGWAHSLHWQYGPPVADSFERTPADVGWFVHLAEGTDDAAANELQQLQALGCLQGNSVLVHAVALSETDVATVIEKGAAVVWCPSSNLTILGRTLPAAHLRSLFDARRLSLGTDSRLSGSRDLLEELRVAAAHSDFSARELLQLVTVHGRNVLRALPAPDDVIIFRRHSADPFANVLRLARAELRVVVRDGEPLIADPDFEPWFEHRGIACTEVCLDGHPKLCATSLLSPPGRAHADIEPGLVAGTRLSFSPIPYNF
jgi:hypothetical protein